MKEPDPITSRPHPERSWPALLTSSMARKLPAALRDRLSAIRDHTVALWQRGSREVQHRAIATWHRGDLIRLGQFYKTDKWGSHWYLRHYQTHFQPLRLKRINLLEIGVGSGDCLRMWKAYFPKANIYGADLFDKGNLQGNRIKIFRGDQSDKAFLRDIVELMGGVDIVVDDGSHINADVIKTFETLFPMLRIPGIYAIEDTQTSYWPGYGGSSDNVDDPATIMGHFTRLTHSLNHEEILRENYSPTVFDLHVVAMHFYHNLILIHKGENKEGTNEYNPRMRIGGTEIQPTSAREIGEP